MDVLYTPVDNVLESDNDDSKDDDEEIVENYAVCASLKSFLMRDCGKGDLGL